MLAGGTHTENRENPKGYPTPGNVASLTVKSTHVISEIYEHRVMVTVPGPPRCREDGRRARAQSSNYGLLCVGLSPAGG